MNEKGSLMGPPPLPTQEELFGRMCKDLAMMLEHSMSEKTCADLCERYRSLGLKDTSLPKLWLFHAAIKDGGMTEQQLDLLLKIMALDHMEDIPNEFGYSPPSHPSRQWPVITDFECGFGLQRGERPILMAPQIEFHQERVTARTYGGGNTGFNIRVAKGLTWRVGGNGGRSRAEKEMQLIGVGQLILTSKRLVFSSSSAGFSLLIAKILNVEFGDYWLSVMKDSVAVSNVPYIFSGCNGRKIAAEIGKIR